VIDGPAVEAASDDQNTGSESSLTRAAKWLRECMSEHDNCNQINSPIDWAPHRLLDVGSSSPSSDVIRLEQTKGWQTPVRYAALSHCWGDIQPLRLVQDNLHQLVHGISIGSLCRSFQDAVHTVRRLGIQYLWIDSLCIIQDSEQDWDIESSLMTYVYGGSMLNIAAAASNNCAGGLFQNQPSSYLGPCLLSVASRDGASILRYQVYDPDLWNAEFETAKLNTRAWVVQERMLSPRTLAFAKTQLFWECRHKRACDEFPSGYPVEYFDKPPMTFKLPSLDSKLKTQALIGREDSRLGKNLTVQLSLAWHNLVMLYSRQNMSFEQDKLVAISGLAILFAQQVHGEYFAGLWKPTLLADLLWEASTCKYPRRRSLTYRSPSWSWASMECPVNYIIGRVTSHRVKVVDVNVQTIIGSSKWSKVTEGCLRLQGKLFPNLGAVFNRDLEIFSLEKRGMNHTIPVADCIPNERAHQDGNVANTESGLLCLPLVSYVNATRAMGYSCEFRGLVLLQGRGQSRGHYQRWGVFEVEHSTFFEDSDNQASSEWYVDREEGIIVIT
jgi:Heterokaryon incompatibility protein (HET)